MSNNLNNISDSVYSSRDIIIFLLKSWKTILLFVFIGIICSVGVLAVSVNKYEAIAHVKMRQFNFNLSDNSWINIEDPNLLIIRLNNPNIYSGKEFNACGIDNIMSPTESLLGMIKLSTLKGVSSILELKVKANSKQIAITCAEILFEKIRNSQNQMIKPYIDEARALLLSHNARLKEIQYFLARTDKPGYEISAVYLSSREELKFLNDEIMRINKFISLSNAHEAKLISPPFASNNTVSPRKMVILLVGLFIGLGVGLLFSLFSISKEIQPYNK
jgi:hypothetical protein